MAADFASGAEIVRVARPGRRAARRGPRSPTRRRRGSRWRSRGHGGRQARPRCRRYLRLRRRARRLPDRLRLGGRARGGRAPPRAGDAPAPRRAAPRALGGAPGRAWERGRYEGPYLRDELLDLGYLVETLETAHTWSRLGELYDAVACRDRRRARRRRERPGLVMCHLSHAYRDGASLYFTFLARRRPGAELEQWRAVKAAACEAIVADGGDDHPPPRGRPRPRPLHARRDRGARDRGPARGQGAPRPAGIMNPGKLIPVRRPTRQGFQGFAVEREVARPS